jgi:hypothetical protein
MIGGSIARVAAVVLTMTSVVAGQAPDLTAQQFQALVQRAQSQGYRVIVQEQPALVSVTLTKEGKTPAGHGILGVKWDERETWKIVYVRQNNRLKLAESQGVIEKKAPVAGTWTQADKLSGLPAAWVMP